MNDFSFSRLVEAHGNKPPPSEKKLRLDCLEIKIARASLTTTEELSRQSTHPAFKGVRWTTASRANKHLKNESFKAIQGCL